MAQVEPNLRFKFGFNKPDNMSTIDEYLKEIQHLCDGVTCQHIWKWLTTDITPTTSISTVLYHIAILKKIISHRFTVTENAKILQNNFNKTLDDLNKVFKDFMIIYDNYLHRFNTSSSISSSGIVNAYNTELKKLRLAKDTFIGTLVDAIKVDHPKMSDEEYFKSAKGFLDICTDPRTPDPNKPGPPKPGPPKPGPELGKRGDSGEILGGPGPSEIPRFPPANQDKSKIKSIQPGLPPPGQKGTLSKDKDMLQAELVPGPGKQLTPPIVLKIKYTIPKLKCEPFDCNTMINGIVLQTDPEIEITQQQKSKVEAEIQTAYKVFNDEVKKLVGSAYDGQIKVLNDKLNSFVNKLNASSPSPSRKPPARPITGGFLNDFTIKQQDNSNSTSKPRFQFAYKY